MPEWAWILLGVGVLGLVGAFLICAAIYEFTSMRFRRWETLP